MSFRDQLKDLCATLRVFLKLWIQFQSFYFKMSCLVQSVTYRFIVIICEIYKQFLSENWNVQ